MLRKPAPKKTTVQIKEFIYHLRQQISVLKNHPAEQLTTIVTICKLTQPTDVMRWLDCCLKNNRISFNKRDRFSNIVRNHLVMLDEKGWEDLKLFFSCHEIDTYTLDKNALKYSEKKREVIITALTKLAISLEYSYVPTLEKIEKDLLKNLRRNFKYSTAGTIIQNSPLYNYTASELALTKSSSKTTPRGENLLSESRDSNKHR